MSSIIETTASIVEMLRTTAGVPVEYAGQHTWGHFGVMDEDLLGDEASVVGEQYQVTVATGALRTLAQGSPITVDGTIYTVHDHRRNSADGALTRILLGERSANPLPVHW